MQRHQGVHWPITTPHLFGRSSTTWFDSRGAAGKAEAYGSRLHTFTLITQATRSHQTELPTSDFALPAIEAVRRLRDVAQQPQVLNILIDSSSQSLLFQDVRLLIRFIALHGTNCHHACHAQMLIRHGSFCAVTFHGSPGRLTSIQNRMAMGMLS